MFIVQANDLRSVSIVLIKKCVLTHFYDKKYTFFAFVNLNLKYSLLLNA